MNAFDLNRKEYIRVNNNDGDPLTDFNKVTFLTSFVITANAAKFLPGTYDASQVQDSNYNLISNTESFCSSQYSDGDGFACYISEISINTSKSGELIPTAKVNVYLMNGITDPNA
jgi:hypothetical protein